MNALNSVKLGFARFFLTCIATTPAMAAGMSIAGGSLTINSGTSISVDGPLVVAPGGSLTILSGGSLSVKGSIFFASGSSVLLGGSMLASDSITINNSLSLLPSDLVSISANNLISLNGSIAGTQTSLLQISAKEMFSRGLISVAPEGQIDINVTHQLSIAQEGSIAVGIDPNNPIISPPIGLPGGSIDINPGKITPSPGGNITLEPVELIVRQNNEPSRIPEPSSLVGLLSLGSYYGAYCFLSAIVEKRKSSDRSIV